MVESNDFEDTPPPVPQTQGKSGQPEELTPTSDPPSDVEIPVDTIYGANLPIDGASEKEDRRTAAEKDDRKHSPPEEERHDQSNAIRIHGLVFVVLLGIIAAGAYFAAELLTKTNRAPQTEEPQQTQAQTQPTQKPEKTKSGFIRDLGIYESNKSYNSFEMAEARAALATQKLVWITGEPSNTSILQVLVAEKQAKGIPIFIITGSDTREGEIDVAVATGLPTYRMRTELERPYSILIIDSKIIVDLSRNRWIWESSEPKIVQDTVSWATQLLDTAELVQ